MNFSFLDSDDDEIINNAPVVEPVIEPPVESTAAAPAARRKGRPRKVSFAVPEKTDFLQELEVSKFTQQQEDDIRRVGEEKELLEFQKKMEKEMKKSPKIPKEPKEEKPPKAEDDGIFSNEPTEILGKEKRILLTKVRQYKQLFPNELRSFRVKKNASVEELKAYIEEMDVVVATGNCDTFLTESLLHCVKAIEGFSAYTERYNITGLADILKANKEFHSLSKQLFVKYGAFANTPPEAQMLLLVATSAYIARSTNIKREELNRYLNEKIDKK